MKKDLMAREAARLLEGSNWLPEPLRLDVDDAVAEAGEPATGDVTDETASEGDAVELPAYLADGDVGASSDAEVTADSEADHLQAAE
jgi:ParB family chromosome partitioning protein